MLEVVHMQDILMDSFILSIVLVLLSYRKKNSIQNYSVLSFRSKLDLDDLSLCSIKLVKFSVFSFEKIS